MSDFGTRAHSCGKCHLSDTGDAPVWQSDTLEPPSTGPHVVEHSSTADRQDGKRTWLKNGCLQCTIPRHKEGNWDSSGVSAITSL